MNKDKIRNKNDDLKAMFKIKSEIEFIIDQLTIKPNTLLSVETINEACQILKNSVEMFDYCAGTSNPIAQKIESELNLKLQNLKIEANGAVDKRLLESCQTIKCLIEKWTSLYNR
jgi:hypothetical protein